MQVSAEEMEAYRHTARLRWQAELHRREERRVVAWELAHQAAALLKQEYAVQRVVAPRFILKTGTTSWQRRPLTCMDSTLVLSACWN